MSIVGGVVAGSAQEKAAKKAADVAGLGSAAQLKFLKDQAAISRGDESRFTSGGGNAFDQYLTQLGVAPGASTPAGTGSNGTNLVPLPGITTTGQHTAKDKPSGLASLGGLVDTKDLPSNANPITVAGRLLGHDSGDGQRPGGALFYDPGSHTVVDSGGNAVAAVPKSGVIPGLVHGFNNQVSIDEAGNLTSVGQHGSNKFNMQLTAGQAPAAAATPAATDPNDRYKGYFQSPGYNFLFDETIRAGKSGGSAKSSLYSGKMLKELQDRGAGVASQDYGAYMSRLADAAHIGQAAASGQAAAASNLGAQGATVIGAGADNQANALLIGANSRASSIGGGFTAASGGLNALANYYGRRAATPKPSGYNDFTGYS